MTKRGKIIVGSLAAIFVLSLAALLFAGNYFVEYALGRKPIELDDPLAPSHTASSVEEDNEAVAAQLVADWLEEIEEEEINLTSYDGLNLYGIQYNQAESSDLWVIAVHGYTSHYTSMQDIAQRYYERGYNAITPNNRAHGYSDGDYITLGGADSQDILTWIDYILTLNPDAQIVLHGVSMGAATVMLAAGDENLPDNVIAVVEDCGYTSAYQMMCDQLEYRFGIPSFPIVDYSRLVSMVKAGYDFADVNPIEAVAKATVPMLFIHGDEDTYVPYYMLDELYEAYDGSHKCILTIKGAEHGAARDIDPNFYYATVFGFLGTD